MADILKPAFRATSGLDAGGEKVINVSKADFNTKTDGVNVEFFIEENTIQEYDSTRGYRKNFAVMFDGRIWTAKEDIAAPAGTFQEPRWTALRTDAKWKYVTSGANNALKSGDYISVSTETSDVGFVLPNTPQDGDTIVIKDVGGKVGYNSLKVKISNQSIIRFNVPVSEVIITKARAESIFIFSNRQWQFYSYEEDEHAIRVTSAAEHRATAGEHIFRTHANPGLVKVMLPKFANNGDIIYFTDLDGLGPIHHLQLRTFDDSTSIGKAGVHQAEYRTSGDGLVVFDAAEKVWRTWDGDLRTRLRIIRDDVKLMPNESVMVFGTNNAIEKTINVELPLSVALGDKVRIAMNYMRKGQKVVIKAAEGDTIATSKSLLQFPKRSEYPPEVEWVQVTSLTFDGTQDYVPIIELSYIEDGTKHYWVVSTNDPTVERVDSKTDETRKRLGVIALASQTQANVDKENNPEKELAITPETLANRTSTESRRGISRLATTAEVVQDSNFAFLDDVIVTPKKLNQRVATETSRGLAEIATQTETNQGTDDTTIITPKKLEARRATENMAGIAKLVSTVGTTAGVDRATKGTNVYDYDNNTDIVTPKSLAQQKATYTEQGSLFIATANEVISGVSQEGFQTAVTPVELHKKTATETRIGFSELATQAETDAGTDDFRIVTPKKLNDRKAREDLTGLARIATQVEFDAGTLDNVISTPLKVKTHFNDTARTSVVTDSGLVEQGTLWNHYTLDIQEASETQRGTARLATQGEVDTGTDDKTVVTPLKLHKKKATESTEGIVKIATQVETVAGTSSITAVSPKNLKHVIQVEKTWEASPILRGLVKISENAITWEGNNVDGSTKPLENYEKSGYAISPYELNKTLANYLPKMGQAEDSRNLDGLDSSQFIRRDIDQTVNGKLTLTKETTVSAPIVSTSTAKFDSVTSVKSVTIGDGTGDAVFNMLGKDNPWNVSSLTSKETLEFKSGDTNALVINKNGNLTSAGQIAAPSVDVSKSYKLNGVNVLTSETIGVTPVVSVGSTTQKLVIKTVDAGKIDIYDKDSPSTPYTVLTTKNAVDIVGNNFVKKIGDNMSGRLTVNAAMSIIMDQDKAMLPLSSETIGTWSTEITKKTHYDKLPGYVVPVFVEGEEGGSTGIVERYEEVKSIGTMSQFGVSAAYTYRIWTPRPQVPQDNHNAVSMYMQMWDSARNTWGQWSRMFTSEAPPTAADIGAVSTAGSAFDNLKIHKWLQIGNVRIEPDETTRTVKFTWVDNP
ncbi:long tail fiber proximal subunit [Kosakonia phage Kc304]|uniref:Long tail fiber proximal subunit n=1 Tax=Serratia phage CHI14 TaxID=2006941 RepID=A0A1Z1LXY9_9CAUD|nr:tail fiber protein proximal subunit [Serratia phage CHI14]ARW57673.1 long tail fiber proximal subunit [Serratia phage CHI14]QYN80693.1 long tail fiber proximal subunit [Kosakonia phage Kc304]